VNSTPLRSTQSDSQIIRDSRPFTSPDKMSTLSETEMNFSDLPTELCLKIWNIAELIPGNVDVWNKDIFNSRRNGEEAYLVPHRMISRSPPPAILHVCRESREVALKHCILEFGAMRDVGDFVVSSRPQIYINPAVDAVCLPRPETFLLYTTSNTGDDDDHDTIHFDTKKEDFRSRLEKLKLKSLAINVWNTKGETFRGNNDINVFSSGEILPHCDALEELILFSDDRYYDCPISHHFVVNDDGESGPLHDMVNLRKLSQDWRMDRLKEGERLLGAHHTTRSGFGYGAMAKYNSMKKHLCKVDGR
jgi:2EXR family